MSSLDVRDSKTGARKCDLCGEIWANRVEQRPGGGLLYNVVRFMIPPAEGPGAQDVMHPPKIDVCRHCVARPVSDLIPQTETAAMAVSVVDITD